MYYGELKEKSIDYQNGHSTGANRALDYAANYFLSYSKKKKLSPIEVSKIIHDFIKLYFENYCNSFGMAESDLEDI